MISKLMTHFDVEHWRVWLPASETNTLIPNKMLYGPIRAYIGSSEGMWPGIVFMAPTGLRAEDKRMIYDRDIIVTALGHRFVVGWYAPQAAWGLWSSVQDTHAVKLMGDHRGVTEGRCKIVGNAYETPELVPGAPYAERKAALDTPDRV